MPQGFQSFRPDGSVDFDIDTLTNRCLGYVALSASAITVINIPVAVGKKAWWIGYTTGVIDAAIYQTDEINFPHRIQTQINAGSTGTLHVFYGEY